MKNPLVSNNTLFFSKLLTHLDCSKSKWYKRCAQRSPLHICPFPSGLSSLTSHSLYYFWFVGLFTFPTGLFTYADRTKYTVTHPPHFITQKCSPCRIEFCMLFSLLNRTAQMPLYVSAEKLLIIFLQLQRTDFVNMPCFIWVLSKLRHNK